MKHILIETNENTYNFFNVKDFHYDKDSASYVLLSQNNELHTFARKNVRSVII